MKLEDLPPHQWDRLPRSNPRTNPKFRGMMNGYRQLEAETNQTLPLYEQANPNINLFLQKHLDQEALAKWVGERVGNNPDWHYAIEADFDAHSYGISFYFQRRVGKGALEAIVIICMGRRFQVVHLRVVRGEKKHYWIDGEMSHYDDWGFVSVGAEDGEGTARFLNLGLALCQNRAHDPVVFLTLMAQ